MEIHIPERRLVQHRHRRVNVKKVLPDKVIDDRPVRHTQTCLRGEKSEVFAREEPHAAKLDKGVGGECDMAWGKRVCG